MKKIFCLLLLFSSCLFAAEIPPQYQLRLVENGVVGDVMGYLPVTDFQKIVKAYTKDAKTQAAEDDNRVVILIIDTPYLLDAATKKYKCRFEIQWLDKDKVPFKIIRLENELTIGEDNTDPEKTIWKTVDAAYTPVAKVGFPIVVVILALILAL